MTEAVLCSNCFRDQGLRLESIRIGIENYFTCTNCGSTDGRKLSKALISQLTHEFFVRGTIRRTRFGGAPVIQFNECQSTSISAAPWFEQDLKLIEKTIGVGFFYYGSRLWMVGEVKPLNALESADKREDVVDRIISEYPSRVLSDGELFYRLRRDPQIPTSPSEYDSPPAGIGPPGRLDSVDFPVLYGSQDLQICIHECRVTVDDDAFVASLAPIKALRLLDLTDLLQEDVTEFESLDIAVHMLFLADKHAYDISRAIAIAAHRAGYDGMIYPSYFSLVRIGVKPFDTIYGISIRTIPRLATQAKAQTIGNIALFGRPIQQGIVAVKCINRLMLRRIEYDVLLGPVGY